MPQPQRDLGVPTGISVALATDFKLEIQVWSPLYKQPPDPGWAPVEDKPLGERGCCAQQTIT